MEIANQHYTGIGSRETPGHILIKMKGIARELRAMKFTLRSGGAPGADTAFEEGAGDSIDLFIPWPGFNGHKEGFVLRGLEYRKVARFASQYHPAWHHCTPRIRELHARNTLQVLGRDLASPSKFVVCWTKDGKFSGGTGQALRIAHDYHIPIFNLHNRHAEANLWAFLGE